MTEHLTIKNKAVNYSDKDLSINTNSAMDNVKPKVKTISASILNDDMSTGDISLAKPVSLTVSDEQAMQIQAQLKEFTLNLLGGYRGVVLDILMAMLKVASYAVISQSSIKAASVTTNLDLAKGSAALIIRQGNASIISSCISTAISAAGSALSGMFIAKSTQLNTKSLTYSHSDQEAINKLTEEAKKLAIRGSIAGAAGSGFSGVAQSAGKFEELNAQAQQKIMEASQAASQQTTSLSGETNQSFMQLRNFIIEQINLIIQNQTSANDAVAQGIKS